MHIILLVEKKGKRFYIHPIANSDGSNANEENFSNGFLSKVDINVYIRFSFSLNFWRC